MCTKRLQFFFIPWSNLKGVALTDFSWLHINQPYSTIYNIKSPEALKSACSRWCVTDNVLSASSALQLPEQFCKHSWLKQCDFFFCMQIKKSCSLCFAPRFQRFLRILKVLVWPVQILISNKTRGLQTLTTPWVLWSFNEPVKESQLKLHFILQFWL